jgi:HK97 family phage major capsid protein
MINLLVGGSPFANSLTRYPTGSVEVAFPTASPDKPAWTPEASALPQIGLNDAADIVAVKKLGEILKLSNESITDTSVNLTTQVGNLLKDAAGPELDRGLLYGSLAAEPKGVVPAAAAAADGTVLDAAITLAIGEIGDAGGTPDTLAAKPSLLAKWRNLRDTQQRMLYPDGIGAAFGLTEVAVPSLADTLVYDSTRLYLIVRTQDFEVALSPDFYFDSDSTALRVRGRFAAGMPAPAKTTRKVTVAGVAPTLEDRPAGKRAA